MSQLEINQLSVSANGAPVIFDASLSLESSKVHILMGPNGSGKSSFLNALMGHPRYVATGGSVSLDGEDITNLSTEQKAKKGLFLSMQHLPEIAGVTLTNFLHRAYKELKNEEITPLDFYKKVESLARDANIDAGFLKKHLNSGLSGGEKKQSEMLQLMALQPTFAFLDEIDSGVDVDAMKKVYAIINTLKTKGMGFLLVSHYPNILEHVTPDTVSVIQGGRITARGKRELAEQIAKTGFDGIK